MTSHKPLYNKSDLVRLTGLAILYAALAIIGLNLFSSGNNFTVIGLSGGLGLVALLLSGKKYYPGIFAGAFAVGILEDYPVWVSASIALGSMLESLLAVWLLQRNQRFSNVLINPLDCLWLLFAAAAGAFVSALAGSWTMLLAGYLTPQDTFQYLVNCWMGSVAGIVLVSMPLLVWRQMPVGWFERNRALETLICFGLAFLAGQIIFLDWFHDSLRPIAKGFLMFVFVTWGALRFGRHGAVLVISMTAMQALLGATSELGYFAHDIAGSGLLNLWFYMLTLTLVGIVIASTIEQQKQITAALQEKELLLSDSQRLAQIGSWMMDLDTGKIHWTEETYRIYGVLPIGTEITAEKFLRCIHPSDRPALQYWISECIAGKRPPDLEFRTVLPNGEIRYLLSRGNLNTTTLGKSRCAIGTVQDISARKRLQTHQVRMLLEASAEAMLIINSEGVILFANRVAVEIFGYTLGELIGLDVDNLAPLRIRPAHAQHRAGFMRAPYPRSMSASRKISAVRKDGSEFPIEVGLNPIEMDNQTVIITAITDISERLQREKAIIEANDLNHQIINSAQEGIIVYDVKGRFRVWNPFMEAITGITRADCLNKRACEVFPFLLDTGIPGGIQRALAGELVKHPPFPWSVPETNRSGWAHSIQAPLRDNEGRVIGVVEVVTDITEIKQAERELELAATVYKAIGEAIMVADACNRIVAVNPAFTKLTGYSEQEAVGQPTTLLKSGQHNEKFYRAMWHSLETTGHWQGEIWNRRKNGQLYHEWLAISNIYGNDGALEQRVAMFSDITDQKLAKQAIWQQANFDALTGLPNRRLFHERLDQEIKKAHRSSQSLALMFLDLDQFKEINDTLGHDIGDLLLQEATRRLINCVRETDTVARLGGDEFTVILTELHNNPTDVERAAQSLLQAIREPFLLGYETVYISTSIGITFYPEDARLAKDLIKNADQAMYASKQQGRNRYRYFSPSMQETAQKRLLIINDLRTALANQQFTIYYQPIVELATGAIHKAEALLRWLHPTRGLVSPAEFISIAEETGLIVEIGDWVLHEAIYRCSQWQKKYDATFQLSVNKSPVQFLNRVDSHNDWLAYLRKLDLPEQSIVIEITEGLLLKGDPVVMERLLALRNAGVQIAIDDFGTGYSALAYLKNFDIDYLKIDQSFVSNLTHESSDMALCEAIIVMAHKLGLRVIAEGVETEAQRDLLLAAGCDYGQGYLFAKPMPAQAFENLLTLSVDVQI